MTLYPEYKYADYLSAVKCWSNRRLISSFRSGPQLVPRTLHKHTYILKGYKPVLGTCILYSICMVRCSVVKPLGRPCMRKHQGKMLGLQSVGLVSAFPDGHARKDLNKEFYAGEGDTGAGSRAEEE